MDLRKLVYFATIAECGSFTKAATKLHVAQSALSRQVKLLEEELELDLFTRTGRTFHLTDAGEALLGHAHDLIHGFERTMSEMQARAGQPRGTVLLGVPPSLGPVVMPQLVDRIHHEFPDISLKIREGTSVVLEEWLADGRIDLALISHEPTTPGTKGDLLVDEHIGLIGSSEIISVAERIGFAAFAHLPLMLTLQVGLLINNALRQATLMFPKTIEIDAIQVVKSLVLRGSGLTLLPVAYFQPELERGDVVAVRIQGTRLTRPIMLASSTTALMSASVRKVAQLARTEVERLRQTGAFRIPDRTRASVIFLPETASSRAGAAARRRQQQRR